MGPLGLRFALGPAILEMISDLVAFGVSEVGTDLHDRSSTAS